jgi:hypothetical protein
MDWRVIAVIVFVAVIYPPLRVVGRWMQRKGSDLEKGPDGPTEREARLPRP